MRRINQDHNLRSDSPPPWSASPSPSSSTSSSHSFGTGAHHSNPSMSLARFRLYGNLRHVPSQEHADLISQLALCCFSQVLSHPHLGLNLKIHQALSGAARGTSEGLAKKRFGGFCQVSGSCWKPKLSLFRVVIYILCFCEAVTFA